MSAYDIDLQRPWARTRQRITVIAIDIKRAVKSAEEMTGMVAYGWEESLMTQFLLRFAGGLLLVAIFFAVQMLVQAAEQL
ncbi:hypothetical protein JOS77_28865 [Chromobacterium haemolyticum]|nr:hypothetical protein JOS77_28865 [Chromobacterium haemolyticum]